MVELEGLNIKRCKSIKWLLMLLLVSTGNVLCAQSQAGHSGASAADSIIKMGATTNFHKIDSSFYDSHYLTAFILKKHPYFNFHERAIPPSYTQKIEVSGKENYFYLIGILLLFFAVSRSVFDKYFNDLLTIFFRRSQRQRQLLQQSVQNTLPSLIFNILFILTAGVYLSFLIQSFENGSGFSFWLLLLYCIAGVAVIYLSKYLFLRLAGWVFGMSKTTDAYIFLIFLVNKIVTLFLLPVIVIIALGTLELKTVALTVSWVVLAGFFVYRFFTAFRFANKELASNPFHFTLYVLSFEILPVLLIYKSISIFLN